jgi:hypothetical protein
LQARLSSFKKNKYAGEDVLPSLGNLAPFVSAHQGNDIGIKEELI